MSTQVVTDRSLEERLSSIPRDRLRPEVRRRLVGLGRGMDRLARLDEESREMYIDEPSLRKLLSEELPPEFVDKYVALMGAQSGASLRASAGGGGSRHRKETPILWETYVRQAVPDVAPAETFEGLGLTGSSTPEDLRDALKSRLPDIPDSFYEPATADRIREAVDRLTSAARAQGAAGPITPLSNYWTPFSECFGGVMANTAFWVAFGVFFAVMMATGDLVAAVVAAAAGLAVWTVISLIYCVLQAVFG